MKAQIVNLNIPIPRGMLFLYDHSASEIEIPTYIEGKTVASSKTAISIATVSDVDDDTQITFTDSQDLKFNQSIELFAGQIFLENGALHLCIMGDDSIARLQMDKGSVNISIFGDKVLHPTSISIVVNNTRENTIE